MTILDYWLKANLYGSLFAGCYWLWLRRHTFLQLNRMYLLLSVVLTLTLPLVDLTADEADVLPASVPVGLLTLPAMAIATPVDTPPATSEPDLERLAALTYGFVALLLLARLGWHLIQIHTLIRQSVRQRFHDFIRVQSTNERITTFSFFRYIVLSPSDADSLVVLHHEQVHVRQWHSADVLFMAVVRALAWACPVLWLLDRALRHVHEYLADQGVLARQQTQPHQYAQFLVDYAFGLPAVTLTHGFAGATLLKARIQMMHRQATTRWALGKYVLVLPLLLVVLAMTAVQNGPPTDTGTPIIVTGRVTRTVDGRGLSGVAVMDGHRLVLTNRQGFYRLTNVAPSATLFFNATGYRTDTKRLTSLASRLRNGQLTLNTLLQPVTENELPAMGATADYKAVRPNPSMPLKTVPTRVVKDGKTYTAAAEPATFPTGIPGLMQYVARNLRYPAKARAAGIQGDVQVLFTVAPSGQVINARVDETAPSPGGGCQEEAVRVVRQMPRWIPAHQYGRPVAGQYQIPIRFTLDQRSQAPTDTLPKTGTLRRPGRDSPTYSANTDRYPAPPDSMRLLSELTTSVRIRSRLQTTPLYVIDGTIVDRIDQLTPDQIAHINVLKGESARALYGQKGQNGVVEITTKKP
ncbi:hypothetical protein GCM10027578_40240 [Spirosoma luteolum]